MLKAIPNSTGQPAHIAIVDDDEDLLRLLGLHLRAEEHLVTAFTTGSAALQAIGTHDFDIVITDVLMTGMSGLELCERVLESDPEMPVLVMTASSTLETAIAAIRVGAYDFITKPINAESLLISVNRAAEHRRLRREVRVLRRAISLDRGLDEMIGRSESIRRVYAFIEQFASSDATVMITGESGTGKELVAHALHRRSRRAKGPMVAVNCAAMPETLLESELFGHEKGAFTDARSRRIGLFVQAHEGTLFLDEIGEMPIQLQPKLLRALEQRTVRPVGASEEVSFDTRLIVATNRDLETAIEEQRFREDLYYRFNVLHIEMPPLRARGRDVLLLAQHFVEQFAHEAEKPVRGLSTAVAAKLMAYDWPGNVRELRNCIERAVALATREELVVEDLPDKVRDFSRKELVLPSRDADELLPMEEVERRYVLRVLDTLGGNKRQAARVLGFDRRTLYRKLEKYGVSTDEKD